MKTLPLPLRLLPLLVATALTAPPAAAAVFGPLGVVAGQSVRVSAVNREAPGAPAAPCQVEVSFKDASGRTFLNSDGLPQVTQLTLAPGMAGAFEFERVAPALQIGPSIRVAVRPVLRRLTPSPNCRLLRSAELFDRATGRTRFVTLPNPLIPGDPTIPSDPVFGLVQGQTARFTVASLLPPGSRQAPVQLELSFVGADGATLVNGGQPLVARVALAPGASASLDAVFIPGNPVTPQRLDLRAVVKRFSVIGTSDALTTLAASRPVVDTTPVVASTEVFDSVSGATAFVVPPALGGQAEDDD